MFFREMFANAKVIGVIGASQCSTDIYELARQVGNEIARRNAILICGGRGGVMEAACQGAQEAGGLTIGILPGALKTEANPYVDLKIVTGMSDARNVIIARTAEALIAIDGAYGTLSEIAFGLNYRKPVIGLRLEFSLEGVIRAKTPLEAVSLAFKQTGSL